MKPLRLIVPLAAVAVAACTGGAETRLPAPTLAASALSASNYTTGVIYAFDLGSEATLDANLGLSGSDQSDIAITNASQDTQGSFDLAFDAAWLSSPRQLQITADLADLIEDGSFDSSDGLLALNASADKHVWARNGNIAADDATTTPVTGRRKIAAAPGKIGSVYQTVPVRAGEDYILSFDLNTSPLYRDDAVRPSSQDTFSVLAAYWTSTNHAARTFAAASLWDPRMNGSSGYAAGGSKAASVSFAAYNYRESLASYYTNGGSLDDAYVTKTLRLRVFDCADQTMYAGGSIATANDIKFNYCNTTDGRALADGGTATQAAPTDMTLYFRHTSATNDATCSGAAASGLAASTLDGAATFAHAGSGNAYCHGALMDNVHLVPAEQIRVDFLAADGTILYTSYQSNGLYLDPALFSQTPATIRITLKKYGTHAPVVHTVQVTSGADIEVTPTAATPRVSLASGTRRIQRAVATTGNLDETATGSPFRRADMRSECWSTDETGSMTKQLCTDMLVDHGLDTVGGSVLWESTVPVRWDAAANGGLGDFEFGWQPQDLDNDGVAAASEAPAIGQSLERCGTSYCAGGTASFTNIGDQVGYLDQFLEAGGTLGVTIPRGPINLGYNPLYGLLVADTTTHTAICQPYWDLDSDPDKAAQSTSSNDAARACCFLMNASTSKYERRAVKNSRNVVAGAVCGIGLFTEPDASGHRTARLAEKDRTTEIYARWLAAFMDLLDGTHTLAYVGRSGGSGDITLPRMTDFVYDYEMNDNQFATVSGCTAMKEWGGGATVCREASLCPSGSRTLGSQTCWSLNEIWSDVRAQALTYAQRSDLSDVRLLAGTTQRPFADLGMWLDIEWYRSILRDSDTLGLGVGATHQSELVVGGVASTVMAPEEMFDEVDALEAALGATKSEVPLYFHDVRSALTFDYDPGCAPFAAEAICAVDSLWRYVTSSSGATTPWSSADRTWSDSDAVTCSQTGIKASGSIKIANNAALASGDTVTVAGVIFTANGGGTTGFAVGATDAATATNLAAAIRASSASSSLTATANGATVDLTAVSAGMTGNLLTLAVKTSANAAITVSGKALTGGAGGPNTYDHFFRGLGKKAGQRLILRELATILSLPTTGLQVQNTGFDISHAFAWDYRGGTSRVDPTGDACIDTEDNDYDQWFMRDADESALSGDLYAQTPVAGGSASSYTTGPTVYGKNLVSNGLQILAPALNDASPFRTEVTLDDPSLEVAGEHYHGTIFQAAGSASTYYALLWWVPETIYGDGNKVNYLQTGSASAGEGIGSSQWSVPFQLLSKYRDFGYLERRLTNVHLPYFASVGAAQVIAIEGTPSSTNANTYTVNGPTSQSGTIVYDATTGDPVLTSIPLGEVPVLVKLTDVVFDGSAAVNDQDGDGVLGPFDCDDHDARAFPGATESCDGIDNDCNGLVDDNASGLGTWYEDLDGDGYGNAAVSLVACTQPAGYVADGTDCADKDAGTHPGASETCDNLDNDCNASVDDHARDATTWYQDLDGDGYGNAAVSLPACKQPAGYVAANTDCADKDAGTYPGATEICDGLDNDCNGSADDNASNAKTYYLDADRDGFGGQTAIRACSLRRGYATTNTDCDDSSANRNPAAAELCNGVDDNCNGAKDENAVDAKTWYRDTDGDGFGASAALVVDCTAPAGYVAALGDCDDGSAKTYPGASETCDGRDNNCNGTVDENAIDAKTYYIDKDGDGYGSTSATVKACATSIPKGYVADKTDCADFDRATHPGAAEVCNGLDDNCSGQIDEGLAQAQYFKDCDGDGYGAGAAVMACGTNAPSVQCKDAGGVVHAGVTNTGDCNASDPKLYKTLTCYTDYDGDCYVTKAATTSPVTSCTAGACADPVHMTEAAAVMGLATTYDTNDNVALGGKQACLTR